MHEFGITLDRMLAVANKSITQVCYLGGVDAAYGRRLLSGQKCHPSPETVLRLWIGIIMCPDLVKHHPTMIEGLAELLEAAAMTAAALQAVESSREASVLGAGG
jgi:hypothetical protein